MACVYRSIAAAAAAVFLVAAAPLPPPSQDNSPPREMKYPIFGKWEITKYVLAPWIEPGEDTKDIAADGEHHLRLSITFAPDKVISKDNTLGCTGANYEPTDFPPDYLFQGGLPEGEQAKIAASYGLPAGNVPGFDLDCSTGLFSYHFANADTLLFALSDVIYWLERKK